MFGRLLIKSLTRRLSRKLLAVAAVWLGMSLVIGLLALTLDAGDKLNRELHSFGANIDLLPAAAAVPVRVGGHELAPVVNTAYLDESQLAALKGIFWANNLLEITPQLVVNGPGYNVVGLALQHLPPHWKLTGALPANDRECLVGVDLARDRGWAVGGTVVATTGLPSQPGVGGPGSTPASFEEPASAEARRGSRPSNDPETFTIAGLVATGGPEDNALIARLAAVQRLAGLPGKISSVAITALTTPENKLAEKYRLDPKALTPTEYERWSCTPYPGGVAANIQSAVPGSVARVVRRVAESQGVVLSRIEGLVFLLGAVATVACALSVMGVLTSAVLERRTEVALLRAIGAQRGNVLNLFLAEAGLLGLVGGGLAAVTGSWLGRWLVHAIFGGVTDAHVALLLVAPLLGLLTALAASTLPIVNTLRQPTAQVLHGN